MLALNEQYRLPPLLQAQMHLADSSGALAVISASGVRTSHGGSQFSTNWDVCGPSGTAREHACWRYPIAKRILNERGVSRESIRDALEATHQNRYGSTIYSHVTNLSTREFDLYYAGDFSRPLRFRLADLIAGGPRSLLMRELFTEAPVVRAFNAWQASGAAAGVKALRAAGGPPERLAESLHELHWNALNQVNRYADGRTFFEAWLAATGGKDPATDFYAGLTALTNGEAEKAEASFARQAEVDLAQGDGPGYGRPAAGFLRALRGERPADANAHFELEGHHDAKFVGVYNITNNTVRAFLLRTKTGWARDFALPPGKIQYAFMVDGEILLDPKNPVTEEATYDGDAEWVGHRKLNATVIAQAPRPER
ncbi:MAG: hypothetical protein JST92_03065 [Deltaproteobacteria bacterium]|nr:hypothetical protein [Deltaproteobacteria bacterium]